jgi:hypothetical protein
MTEIRRCRQEDITQVSEFIDNHWAKGHVLAVNQNLMDWQHKAEDGNYDYLLAWHNQELVGILGYISTRRYDLALIDQNVIWLALWKVLDNCGVTGLGLRMLRELERVEPHVGIAINKILPEHSPLYRALRYQVVELNQYFVTNPDKPSQLISALPGTLMPVPKGRGVTLAEMDEEGLNRLNPGSIPSKSMPLKTPLYFLNRFIRHPFYRYRVFQVIRRSEVVALIALRIACGENIRVLRIVDFTGDFSAIGEIGESIAEIMNEEDAEYMDFWQYGVSSEYLEQAGFKYVDPDGSVVVPNYFEPFLAKTSRILSTYKLNASDSFMIFKADGDQDRPNFLS